VVKVWASIGSNIDRSKNICSAIKSLHENFQQLIISPIYETPSEGFDGDPFYNLVIGFHTEFSIEKLKSLFNEIENKNGRRRTSDKFISRTLDIDLICYGDSVIDENGKFLPDKEIETYAFILKPLFDVAPNEIHPRLKISYSEIWKNFPNEKKNLKKVSLDL
tara:strand:+ start:1835 stop:2323 length:489 start_codon:yes stop_codon:yes gene_type:complete